MKKFVITALLATIGSSAFADGFAGRVVSYSAGTTPAPRDYWQDVSPWGKMETVALTDPSVALGKPTGFVTEPHHTLSDGSIVSPFNPAANEDQIVSIGEGGSLTLELENYATVGAGVEIGLFANIGVYTYAGTSGTLGVDDVTVEFSANGTDWSAPQTITPDIPTDVWVDATNPYLGSPDGLTEADFSKPFTGVNADLVGKTYEEIKTAFDGSAGGYWLDLSGTGLSEVGYIRFTVPDDGIVNDFPLNFELDAVSIAAGHVGAPLPEPCTLSLLALAGVSLLRRRKK